MYSDMIFCTSRNRLCSHCVEEYNIKYVNHAERANILLFLSSFVDGPINYNSTFMADLLHNQKVFCI